MILDSVSSFIENLKSKVSNPFFGTLIAVWTVRNWKLIYGLFIFDEDCLMSDKFEFVSNHFKDKNIFSELWINIIITFGLLILGYTLLIISRFLANLVEHRITPNINRVAASNLVANKDILIELEIQLLKKTNDLINERKLMNELELQLVEIRGKIELAVSEKNSAVSKLGEQTKQNREGKKSIEILENKNNNLSSDLIESRKLGSVARKLESKCNELISKKDIPNKHLNSYLNLWNYNLIQEFADMITVFDSGTKKFKTIEINNNFIKILIDNKIVSANLNIEEKSTIITYTEQGEDFAKMFFTIKKEFNGLFMPW